MDALIEILKTIFLAIVEGITEWLPISSTGHMILVDEFLQLKVSAEFKEMFFVVIQLGAIMAVVLMYFHKLNPFSKKKTATQRENTWKLWFKVLVACVPAAVLGLLFDDLLDKYLYNFPTVAVTLLVYGILFIVIENRNKNRKPGITRLSELDYRTALLIGGFQVLSLIPGTSRSGATILGAIILGCSRYVAAEFSFFLAIPVMFGASGLKLVKYFMKTGFHMSGLEIAILLIGMLVAFVVSVFAIKFLMQYIKKRDFKSFGYYRIILGLLVLAYFAYTLFVK